MFAAWCDYVPELHELCMPHVHANLGIWAVDVCKLPANQVRCIPQALSVAELHSSVAPVLHPTRVLQGETLQAHCFPCRCSRHPMPQCYSDNSKLDWDSAAAGWRLQPGAREFDYAFDLQDGS